MNPKSLFLQPAMRPLVALFTLLLAFSNQAQPVCSIDIGPDHTICQGESVTLNGPPGYNGYLWSNGSNAESITVNTAGNYWVQVSYPTGEMVTNGNFDAGNTGFTTQFNYSPLLQTDGNYFIGTNAATYHPQFAGTGNGNFLMVNAGWMHGYWQVWCQSHPVCPGQTYQLRFRAVSLASQGPPTLQWFVNGEGTNVDHTAPLPQGNWQYFTTMWTAPAGVTNADFCVRITSGYGVGNDFGLDDISISSTVVLSDEVNVNVTPLPAVDLGANAMLCDGESLVLDVALPGATYLWQDGSTSSTYQVNTPGNYGVTVTANNCTASDDILVSYLPNPQVDLGPDLTLCEGNTAILDATVPGAQYEWHDGSTGSTYTVAAAGIHTVSVTLNGCTTNDIVDVSYNALPVVQLGPDRTICAGETTIFDVTTPGGTYLWHDGSTGPTLTATTAGNISVEVTVNGCTSSDDANVLLNPLPIVDLGPDQVVCPGTPVVLNAALPGANYLWSTGSTAASITATAVGTYWVEVTVNGCTATDTVIISEHVLPLVDLGDELQLCTGSTSNIGATVPNATYVWNTGATTSHIDVNSPGIYWLDVTQNGCTVRDSISVIDVPLPVVDLGPAPTVCPGGTAQLDATTAGATYAWSTGESSPSIEATAGTHSVDVTVNGCTSSASITISEFTAPTLSLGNDTTLCPDEELTLDVALNGASYSWQDGSTSPTFVVSAAGNYSVTITDQNGCTAFDQFEVSYATPGSVELGADATICQGEELLLDATLPGASYLWNTGATTATISVSDPGTFSVTVTQGACVVSDQINLQVEDAPVVDLGNDTTLCPGETLLLELDQPGSSIEWNTGATGSSITIDQPGTYSVTVTNIAGCTTVASMEVLYASPDAVDLGADASICSGNELMLDASLPGAVHLWSTGATSPTITVASAGTYWVQVTQGSCLVSDTIDVAVQPVANIDLGDDITLCEGDEAVLDAAWPGAAYTWSTGATTSSITVSEAGTFSVELDLNGCMTTDAVEVSVVSTANLDLGPDITACSGDQIILDAASEGAQYLWNTGATTQTLEAATSGTYWVQVTLGNCVASDTVTVSIEQMPEISLGDDQVLCEGEEILLDASWPGASYVWSSGETSSSITVSQSGVFSVVTTLGECSATDEIVINVQPVPVVDLGADPTICSNEFLEFDVTTPGATYLWHDGSTEATYSTSGSGIVSVTVSLGDCSASDTVLVSVVEGVTADLGGDAILCEGTTMELNAFQEGATYLWDDGTTDPQRTIHGAGVYWVNVVRNDCMDSDTITVELFAPEMVDLGSDITLCPDEVVELTSPIPGSIDLWSTGSTSNSIVVSQPGIYWLQVMLDGCVATDSIEVSLIEMEPVDLGDDIVICESDEVELTVDPGDAFVQWSTGATTNSITVNEAGSVSVTLEMNGCILEDMIDISVMSPITSINLGPAQAICPGDVVSIEVTLPFEADLVWDTGTTGPLLDVTSPGLYTVYATGYCVDAEGTAVVIEGDCGAVVHVPNSFTPNNDGINDVFRAVVDGDLSAFRLEIFDRWGAPVFMTRDQHAGWDGTLNGSPVKDGVYVWQMSYRLAGTGVANSEKRMGHVTLLR